MTSLREQPPATRAAVVSALIGVQVCFGLHYVAAKYIMTAIPPRAWATLRIVPAAALLIGYALLTRARELPRAPRDLAAIAFYAIFGVVINQVCFVEGLARTRTSHSSLINTSIPVATLLIAILARRERATGRKLAGIALSLGGVLYLIGHTGASLSSGLVAGDLLTLANALSYSLFLVISKPILARHSSLAVTAELLGFGALGIAALGLGQLASLDVSRVPGGVWAAAVFVVLFPTVAAYLLNAWALKRVESSLVALFIYLQPLLASGVAVIYPGESLGPEVVAAAVLVFAGVAVALRRGPAGPIVPVAGG